MSIVYRKTAKGLAEIETRASSGRAKTIPEVQPLPAGSAQTLRGVGRDPLADEFISRFVTPRRLTRRSSRINHPVSCERAGGALKTMATAFVVGGLDATRCWAGRP